MNSTIHILCASDNNFSMLLAAMIKSVEVNHLSKEELLFHIIDDKISVKNKKKVELSIDKSISKINWISIKNVWPEKMYYDKSSFPIIANARLFLSHYIDAKIEKILYLDVDLIIQKEISDLWNIDLGENVAAGVVDHRIKIIGSWGGIKQYKEIGLSENDPYYNSGVLLIDTKKWREMKLGEKALEYQKNYNIDEWADQHAINIVLHKKWVTLDPLWNHFAENDHENPFIIHFIATKPIFKNYKFVDRYRKIFFEYLNMTEWAGFKPLDGKIIILRKIKNKIKKRLKSLVA